MSAATSPHTPGHTGHAVVIGGGISGLAAAHRLRTGGARVTLLEASARLGGKLYAGEIEGVPVDLGAESMLARRPEGVELARAVGLGGRLQPPATATASLWTRGALRPMPKGHVMGVPGDLAPLAASGVLSDEGLARIAARHVAAAAPRSARTWRWASSSRRGSAARSWTGWSSRCSAACTRGMRTASRCGPRCPPSSRLARARPLAHRGGPRADRRRPPSGRTGRCSRASTAASAGCRSRWPTPQGRGRRRSVPTRPYGSCGGPPTAGPSSPTTRRCGPTRSCWRSPRPPPPGCWPPTPRPPPPSWPPSTTRPWRWSPWPSAARTWRRPPRAAASWSRRSTATRSRRPRSPAASGAGSATPRPTLFVLRTSIGPVRRRGASGARRRRSGTAVARRSGRGRRASPPSRWRPA